MLLPSKLYSYSESSLGLMPYVLRLFDTPEKTYSAKELYQICRSQLEDPSDFLGVMDCLFSLGAIDFNNEGELFKCL